MSFSPFDKRLLEEGLTFFSRPRMASLLEALGTSEGERVDTLATMLRHAAPDEFAEAVAVFERALARVAREQERDRDRRPDDESRRRRYSAAAERRELRRRSA
jgi:hypothetical protein